MEQAILILLSALSQILTKSFLLRLDVGIVMGFATLFFVVLQSLPCRNQKFDIFFGVGYRVLLCLTAVWLAAFLYF